MPLTRGGFRHYDYDRMVVWKWHALFSYAATTWMDQLEGIHHHIAGVPFAVRSRAVLKRDKGRLSNGEKVNRLAGFVFEAWRVS